MNVSEQKPGFDDNMRAIDLLSRIIVLTDPFVAPDLNFKYAVDNPTQNQTAIVVQMIAFLGGFKGGSRCYQDVNPVGGNPGFYYVNRLPAEHATYEAVRTAFGFSATQTFEEVKEALLLVLGGGNAKRAIQRVPNEGDIKLVWTFLLAWRQEARKALQKLGVEADREVLSHSFQQRAAVETV